MEYMDSGGQYLHHGRSTRHIQGAPDRSGWHDIGEHIRTGCDIRGTWLRGTRGFAANGSRIGRGHEKAEDRFHITQDEEERMDLGR
eukprot:12427715-Heterocapsa_arctica.AAC.1